MSRQTMMMRQAAREALLTRQARYDALQHYLSGLMGFPVKRMGPWLGYCPVRLLHTGRRRLAWWADGERPEPDFDYTQRWVRDEPGQRRRPVLLTSEPYATVTPALIAEQEAWCQRWGVAAHRGERAVGVESAGDDPAGVRRRSGRGLAGHQAQAGEPEMLGRLAW